MTEENLEQVNPQDFQPFTVISNEIFGNTNVYEKAVLLALHYHEGRLHSTHKRIAELAGNISISKLKETLLSLKEKGFISWEEKYKKDGTQTSNYYYLNKKEVV